MLIVVVLVSGCTNQPVNQEQTQTTTSYTIGFAEDSSGSSYLTDSRGFTLYTYQKDTPGSGTSSCTGGCISAWPAFLVDNIMVESGLDQTKFGTITRDDGTTQIQYDGWPLYFYKGDSKPGDVKGNNVANFVVANLK